MRSRNQIPSDNELITSNGVGTYSNERIKTQQQEGHWIPERISSSAVMGRWGRRRRVGIEERRYFFFKANGGCRYGCRSAVTEHDNDCDDLRIFVWKKRKLRRFWDSRWCVPSILQQLWCTMFFPWHGPDERMASHSFCLATMRCHSPVLCSCGETSHCTERLVINKTAADSLERTRFWRYREDMVLFFNNNQLQ